MQGQYAALNEKTGTEDDDEVHHISFAPSHDGGCGVREPAPIAFLRDKDMFRIFFSYVAPHLEGEPDCRKYLVTSKTLWCLYGGPQDNDWAFEEEEVPCTEEEEVPCTYVSLFFFISLTRFEKTPHIPPYMDESQNTRYITSHSHPLTMGVVG